MSNQKLVYITGAGRGIGRAIALYLSKSGYLVSGCARSISELAETRELSGGKVSIACVDVRDPNALESWFREEATSAEKSEAEPWALVTAAGIYGPIGPFLENSWDKWKESIDINLYGTALASKIFAKTLIAAKKPGHIIMMSGGGATQPLSNLTSYCASKAAVVRFGETLAHELREYNITVNAIAPGAVNTKLTDELIEAGPLKAGKEMYEKTLRQKEEGGANPEKASELAKFLMSEEARNITGRLISAIWDPWEKLDTMDLEKSDIYTLRRIVPKDREK